MMRWGWSPGGRCWGWPNYSLFSFCLTELLLSVDEQASNGTWEGEAKKKRRNRRGGGEGREKINFSQTEAGWSNGGLKEEEEERTYFSLITSCSLSGKPWKLALLQPVVSLIWPFRRGYGVLLLLSSAAIRLLGGEDPLCKKKNIYIYTYMQKWQSNWPNRLWT